MSLDSIYQRCKLNIENPRRQDQNQEEAIKRFFFNFFFNALEIILSYLSGINSEYSKRFYFKIVLRKTSELMSFLSPGADTTNFAWLCPREIEKKTIKN